jgi:hypothetical protein
VTETVLFVDLAMTQESYARDHLSQLLQYSERFGVAPDVAREWFRSLEARSDAGTFYYALPWTYVVARST